jgi:uncharacterized protein YbjT (DUF2867 family)
VPRLVADGHQVRCLVRDPAKLAGVPWAGDVDVVRGDVLDEDAMACALSGVDVLYYLVHSLGRRDFAERDRRAATLTSRAARASGVDRIVYLGGIRPSTPASEHLGSRAEVGDILLGSGVPTAVLQAAVIIGSGSVSFEMLRYLTENLPVMVTPKWVRNRIQPIAIRDVLHYLAAAADLPAGCNRRFDIGGPDVLTYEQMMRRFAVVAGLDRRRILGLPLLSPKLSSYWINLVTPVPRAIATPLIDSMINEVVCRDHDIDRWLPAPPHGATGFDEAVGLALAQIPHADPQPRWSTASVCARPAEGLPSDPPWSGGYAYTDERVRMTSASPHQLWQVIERLGGEHRWWRAQWLARGSQVRLLPTLRLPGRAWLDVAVDPGPGQGVRYRQRAVFVPHGLGGHVYWWLMRPLHALVAGAITRQVVRTAEGRTRWVRWPRPW